MGRRIQANANANGEGEEDEEYHLDEDWKTHRNSIDAEERYDFEDEDGVEPPRCSPELEKLPDLQEDEEPEPYVPKSYDHEKTEEDIFAFAKSRLLLWPAFCFMVNSLQHPLALPLVFFWLSLASLWFFPEASLACIWSQKSFPDFGTCDRRDFGRV